MNIESLLNKIKLFEELVIESGFKRDVTDYQQSIGQSQNQNLSFMKERSEEIKSNLKFFDDNSLDSELKIVLRENKPFTSLNTLEELEELDSDKEIDAQKYYQKFNSILSRLNKAIQSNESELNTVRIRWIELLY